MNATVPDIVALAEHLAVARYLNNILRGARGWGHLDPQHLALVRRDYEAHMDAAVAIARRVVVVPRSLFVQLADVPGVHSDTHFDGTPVDPERVARWLAQAKQEAA